MSLPAVVTSPSAAPSGVPGVARRTHMGPFTSPGTRCRGRRYHPRRQRCAKEPRGVSCESHGTRECGEGGGIDELGSSGRGWRAREAGMKLIEDPFPINHLPSPWRLEASWTRNLQIGGWGVEGSQPPPRLQGDAAAAELARNAQHRGSNTSSEQWGPFALPPCSAFSRSRGLG